MGFKIIKGKMILIVGFLLAVIAGLLVVQAQSFINSNVEVVFCGGQNILPNTVITDDMLTMEEIPKVIAEKQNVFYGKEELIGKTAASLIQSGTLILKTQVYNVRAGRGTISTKLSLYKDPELMAYTISTNPTSAVGGEISQDDIVNIIANFETSESNGRKKERVAKMIVPYVRVLDTVGTKSKIKGVTVMLTAQQILDIEFAQKRGTISFALLPMDHTRKPLDNVITNENSFLARQYSGYTIDLNSIQQESVEPTSQDDE